MTIYITVLNLLKILIRDIVDEDLQKLTQIPMIRITFRFGQSR